MSKRGQISPALILKRRNWGEADRLVTILTPELGKLTVVAKGARKLSSRQRAALEPGSYIKGLLITTHAMPLLTQATLLEDCQVIHTSLTKLRQLSQLLEIVDTLFVEQIGEPELFEQVMAARAEIVTDQPTTNKLTEILGEMLVNLGYQHPSETSYSSLNEYVGVLADKSLKSWDYLKVK